MSRTRPDRTYSHSNPSCVRRFGAESDAGMTIFHACTPPGRVSGTTVRPFHLPWFEPDAWVADLGGADEVVDRHPIHLSQR